MRLIDADALLRGKEDHDMISTHVIYNTPTIDAVPVIRCRDCKYYDGFECSRYADETYGMSHSTQEYGYCWLAERKEE